ncbi:MAG: membrane dipeptidase [Pseudomonadota bacterium]
MRFLARWVGRLFVLLLLGVGLVLTFGPAQIESDRNAVVDLDPFTISEDARALHDTLIVGDWHADSLLWKRDIADRGDRGHVDIPRLIEGNVALQVFAAVTKSPAGQNYDSNSADAFDNITPLAIGQLWPPRTWNSLLERALYQAEKLQDVQRRRPERVSIIKTRADLEAHLEARSAGSKAVGAILGIEGAHALEGDIANLDKIEAAGHRVIGLQHFFDNSLGGSLHGFGNKGLTDFGRSVVAQIEALGMVLDLAHSSPQVARDVIAMTDMPIVVTHTGIHGFCPVKRNFKDDLMQAIAETGGVIGIGYWRHVTCGDISPAGVAQMIVKGVEVVGIDHLSLGSDFDGSVTTGFDTSELAALTQALLDAGLTKGDVRKVMGENMVRVLRARLQ